MLTVVIALAAVGVGFYLGRQYEARRVAALIAWACALAGEVQVSVAALEAARQAGETSEESEARVH